MFKELKVDYWVLIAIVFSTSLGLIFGIPIGVYAEKYDMPALSNNGLNIAMIMLLSSIGMLIIIYLKEKFGLFKNDTYDDKTN